MILFARKSTSAQDTEEERLVQFDSSLIVRFGHFINIGSKKKLCMEFPIHFEDNSKKIATF